MVVGVVGMVVGVGQLAMSRSMRCSRSIRMSHGVDVVLPIPGVPTAAMR